MQTEITIAAHLVPPHLKKYFQPRLCGQCYVCHQVEIFREVRRVLRDDASLWLNLGDSYQNKQLQGIPWKVAFALQDDGWILRSDIIWHKKNTMPESETDRPTKAHEYLFLLSKSARYYWDQDAVREESSPTSAGNRKEFRGGGSYTGGNSYDNSAVKENRTPGNDGNPAGRNIRTVWTIPTFPFPSVVSYGSYRISSPDCPVHDYHDDLELVRQCGEQLAAFPSGYNPDTGDGPAQGQEGVVVSIPVGRFASLSGVFAAIPHSTQMSKTVSESEQDVTFYGILGDRTEYKRFLSRCASKFDHTRGNKTGPDSAADEQATDPSGQKTFHIVGIETYQTPSVYCTCHYTGKPKKSQDHFAVFPPALVEPCIKAGTSERGCCPECGAPWERVVEKQAITAHDGKTGSAYKEGTTANRLALLRQAARERGGEYQNLSTTIDWRPGCECGGEPVPCRTLDPFFGAGTVGLVSDRLGRDCTGIELNGEYVEMAEKRITDDAPMFAEVEVS